jgi:hypothetical protein
VNSYLSKDENRNLGPKASDPRDRIFGILGLASDSDELKIYPTTPSLVQLYTKVAMALIMQGDLALLSLSFSLKSRPAYRCGYLIGCILELPCALISIPGDVPNLPRDTTHSASKFLKTVAKSF